MKVATILAAAGLVHAGLASAIPTHGHKNLHVEARDPAAPVVVTETTTLYETVIWVDNDGKPVSTQVNSNTSPTEEPLVPVAAMPADLGAIKRPSQMPHPPMGSQRPSALPAAKPPSPSPPGAPGPPGPPVPKPAASSSETGDGATSGGTDTKSGGSVAPGGMGICYDMINSQTQCKDPGTIISEFGFLKSQGFGIVRIYDIGCPVGDFIAGAAQQGIQLMIGINAIGNLQNDLGKLIDMAKSNWGPVHTVYIGNEQVNQGQASAAQVAAAVTTARSILSGAGYNGAVVTVDTFNIMQSDPTACSTSDYCAANAHAYFDPNTSADKAGSFVMNAYNAVASANNGKQVVITESGWPYAGNCNGAACPSPENQKTAMNSIMSSFAGMPGNLYLFQAYNAGYKSGGSLGIENHFGIYDQDHYVGGIGAP